MARDAIQPGPVGRVADRGIRIALWGFTVASLGIVAMGVLTRLADPDRVWDDAYMFVRYADNVLAHGAIAWNPSGPPTYGLTSPLYLVVVVPMRLLAPDSPPLAAALSSCVSGLAFLALLVWLLARHLDAGPLLRHALVVVALASLAAASVAIGMHFLSGMDTMFALAYLTGYILLAKEYERSRATGAAVALGVMGGLAFAARPDLLLFTILVPAALLARAGERHGRRQALAILGITGLLVIAQAGVASWYFGSPLPLPFYAKSLRLIQVYVLDTWRFTAIAQLIDFGQAYWYFFLAVALVVCGNFGVWRRRAAAVDQGLALAIVLFILYYATLVVQVMFYAQRFYYPVLPALIWLGCQSLAELLHAAPDPLRQALRHPARAHFALAVGLLALFLFPMPFSAANIIRRPAARANFTRFDVAASYDVAIRSQLLALDRFSLLPDDLVIATSEVGHPAAFSPGRPIVDLVGLNDTIFAHEGFSADVLFTQYRPDLLYLPHPYYVETDQLIRNDPRFARDYEYFPAEQVHTLMGLALRRDSPYYQAMRAIVVEAVAW